VTSGPHAPTFRRTVVRRFAGTAVRLCFGVLFAAAPLAAQVPERPAPDSTRRAPAAADSAAAAARADSLARAGADSAQKALPDSLNPDSLRPVMPTLGPAPGPLPAANRYVFDADALRWSGAQTLGELLARIPGVYLVRAGWFGQAETVSYAGQGARSIELDWDGFVLDPIGADSAGFDTGRFDIGLLRRVEVEVLPTVLRVHLISDVQTVRRARTEASFATGDAATNSYRLRYLNRWRNGAGLSVGASFLGSEGPPPASASVSQLQLFGKLTWLVGDRTGIEVLFDAASISREALTRTLGGGTPVAGIDGHRNDLFVRAFTASRPDGMGLRLDAVLGSSSYGDTSRTSDSTAGQASLTAGYRAERWSVESWGRMRDGRDQADLGARAAWSPLRLLTLTGSAGRRTFLGSHSFREAALGAEFRPLDWVALHGDLRSRRLDDSLFTAADTAESPADWRAGIGITRRLFDLDVSFGHQGALTAPAFGWFRAQVPNAGAEATGTMELSWQLRLRPWLSLGGWVRNPSSRRIPFDPPTHSITALTFRSAFLPKFRRNVFDLMFRLQMEGWGRGVAGFDSTGAAIPLPGHVIFDFHVQFRLVGALIYWTMRNTQREYYSSIPGFDMPRSLQRFGIRWEFAN